MKLTNKTKQRLLKFTALNLAECLKCNKALANTMNLISQLNTNNSEVLTADFINEINSRRRSLSKLCNYSILLNLILSDLAVCVRNTINSTIQYERDHSAKLVIITINEGFKRIYNFDNNNNPLNMSIKKYEKGSLFIRDIGAMIADDFSDLTPNFNTLTLELENFNDEDLKSLKDLRELSVHYDINAKAVFDMLDMMDVDFYFRLSAKFMSILKDMTAFNHSLIKRYNNQLFDCCQEYLKQLETQKKRNVDEPIALELIIEKQKRVIEIMQDNHSLLIRD